VKEAQTRWVQTSLKRWRTAEIIRNHWRAARELVAELLKVYRKRGIIDDVADGTPASNQKEKKCKVFKRPFSKRTYSIRNEESSYR
jgi:translation initiation factor 2 alpha subunit (eIF-2alpha)